MRKPNNTEKTKNRELYLKVRAAFVAQGTTLNRWCIEHGEFRQIARAALLGIRKGPKAKALRARLLKELRMEDEL